MTAKHKPAYERRLKRRAAERAGRRTQPPQSPGKGPHIDLSEAIAEIKALVASRGYIYALCMILSEDFSVIVEELHQVNQLERLSVKEASLLLGFLIQAPIDFTKPQGPKALMELKQRTYALMDALHDCFRLAFLNELKTAMKCEHRSEGYRAEQKAFFGRGGMLMESILYSGTGVYDFQYSEFLEQKYKYDEDWLSEKKGFRFHEMNKIAWRIKEILQTKSRKVHHQSLKERFPEMIEKMKKRYPKEDWEKQAKEIFPFLELRQYKELFQKDVESESDMGTSSSTELAWESFLDNLIELFVIRPKDLDSSLHVRRFLDTFSVNPAEDVNSEFVSVGNYNMIESHPIIRLDRERYLVPITFSVFEAIYDAPFYWMIDSPDYKNRAAANRGRVGEEIAYRFLSQVFGSSKTHMSVKISSGKGHDTTDIDVLCILGSKALCVQVKSKKLTLLARSGDDEQLKKDFQAAVQDAYEQGLLARREILHGSPAFVDRNGSTIELSEEIDEVYMMGITTENYPSLTYQSSIMLNKRDEDPFPVILTVFDLELLAHYLPDPYDFLYYIRQRTSLMDYFVADEEATYLGYHLKHKLWGAPDISMAMLDRSYAKMIDRNYYPFKMGIEVPDAGDALKATWKSDDFDSLCDQLKEIRQPKVTDIIFHLLDESSTARETIVGSIKSTKKKTLNDDNAHDFVMPPDLTYPCGCGITYLSLESDDLEELSRRLLTMCQARKYKSKSNAWIGFGSIRSSRRMIDIVAFSNEKWEHNDDLEQLTDAYFEAKRPGQFIGLKGKVGRNDPCPCGSGEKYKRCCGRPERQS